MILERQGLNQTYESCNVMSELLDYFMVELLILMTDLCFCVVGACEENGDEGGSRRAVSSVEG